MDGTVHAAAAEQCAVRRIHDGVDAKRRYVGDADVKLRRADGGGDER